ncbi:hypothetical protein [Caldifermentibacillus hisashii]|uniref:hypothetical protein n=1 Tax=Caldifermentibacillus hisashii TaxID=996558 RepID=UPI003D2239D7
MAVNKNVMIIPAIKRVGNNRKEDETPKLRVAAYCRVSTDSDEQASSYEVTIQSLSRRIQSGNLQGFLLMMASAVQIQKIVMNLIE